MWLDKVIALWSPMMRSTNELARLNKLWERFNNGEDVKLEILSQEWKYHLEKANLLLEFHYIVLSNLKSK